LAAAQSTQSATFTIQSYPLLANSHIAVDLNGDGILDLAGPAANGAAVMLGNTNGTFQARVNFPAGGQTQELAAGDFNSAGYQDYLAESVNQLDALSSSAFAPDLEVLDRVVQSLAVESP
jgi:hypothetical protein